MAMRLDSTQITTTTKKPRRESRGISSTYLGKCGAQKVATILPTTKPISPRATACCMIIAAMVRFLVPISLSTAISRILPRVRV